MDCHKPRYRNSWADTHINTAFTWNMKNLIIIISDQQLLCVGRMSKYLEKVFTGHGMLATSGSMSKILKIRTKCLHVLRIPDKNQDTVQIDYGLV